MTQSNPYQQITDRIIASLEAGDVPWRKPWRNVRPLSLSSGKPYKGINAWLLGMSEYSSPFWGTYRRIKELGGQVRKGEAHTKVVGWRIIETTNEDGKVKKVPFMKIHQVFNADQADGLPDHYYAEGLSYDETQSTQLSQAILDGYHGSESGPAYLEGGSRACYSPSMDLVACPPKDLFESVEAYYSTRFHEVTHSTGHKDRLARDGVVEAHFFGDELYSAEELVAELGAAFLCAQVGFAPDATIDNSASYIKHWLTKLKSDPKLIVRAASKATKAVELIAGDYIDDTPTTLVELEEEVSV